METATNTGILTIQQAAEVLAVEPIAVQRLIALELLSDNRNARGSVVMQADLERFIGRGSLRVDDMPRLAHGWFAGIESFPSRSEFIGRIMRDAENLSPVTDAAIQRAIEKAPRTQREFTFIVQPTAAMIAAYRLDDASRFLSKQPKGYSVGVGFLARALRDFAFRDVRRHEPKLASNLVKLYDSPAGFAAIVDAAAEQTSKTRLETREIRPVLNRDNPVTVIRRVELASLSVSLADDMRRAKTLAF